MHGQVHAITGGLCVFLLQNKTLPYFDTQTVDSASTKLILYLDIIFHISFCICHIAPQKQSSTPHTEAQTVCLPPFLSIQCHVASLRPFLNLDFSVSTVKMFLFCDAYDLQVALLEPLMCKLLYWHFDHIAYQFLGEEVGIAEVLSDSAIWLLR